MWGGRRRRLLSNSSHFCRMRQTLCRLYKFRLKSCRIFLILRGCKPIVSMLKCVAYNTFAKEVIETEEHLGRSFKRLHFLLDQAINQRLLELDLTTAQGRIIGYLTHRSEPPCARDLETDFGLSHATVSGILSRMESKGFIEIQPDPDDRRVRRICLLEKGRACSQEIARHIRDTEQSMAEGFSPQELALLRSFLKRAIGNLNQANQPNREE